MNRLFSIFAASLLLLAACQKKTSSLSIDSRPKEVRLNLKTEPPTLDPRKGGDVISSHMHFLLFEGLVKLNPDHSISPAQAKTFEISEDGTVYTFTLRDSLWSDGSPVTAYDFETSWKDILDPVFPSQNAHLLYPIKNAEAAKRGELPLSEVGIVAKDAKTLVVTLDRPTPYFLDLISFCVFFPVHTQNDRKYPNWAAEAGEHFISNGPFILQSWKHNDEIVALKNPTYWDATRVRPDQIHFSMVDNETTALQMFEQQDLHMIGEPLSPLPVDALMHLKKTGMLKAYASPATTMITFNVEKAPFNNANIRKALAYAIDRQSIVNNITQMGELVAVGIVPPMLKNDHDYPFFKDHDVEIAKALLEKGLEELGATAEIFKDVVFLYSVGDMNKKVVQSVQQQWHEALGIQIAIESYDQKVVMDKLIKGTYDLAQGFWFAQYSDQMNILERFKYKANVKNYPNWEHPEYIRLLEASSYENGKRRAEILQEAEALFISEMPICPIYHWVSTFMVQPHLKNVDVTPIGDIVFEELTLEQRTHVR